MKTLLTILLLTVSVCVGQDKAKNQKDSLIIWEGESSWALFDRYGNLESHSSNYKPRLSDYKNLMKGLAFILDAYAKECYADSTETGIVRIVGLPDSLGRYKFRKEYWHNTKPTLEGFVEFLKRKTK